MRSKVSPTGQVAGRTFTETARRAQIMAAAIDTIAELGYGQASLARIAEAAGTSKGVIIYHFGSRDELIKELVADLIAKAGGYMRPRIEAEQTGAGMLRAYIESNLMFMAANRSHVVATVEIALNARAADGSRLYDSAYHDMSVASVQALLVRFQGAGEFLSSFDPLVMALAIRAAIDSVAPLLARDPGLDVGHRARELADLFLRAASPEGSHEVARRQSLEE